MGLVDIARNWETWLQILHFNGLRVYFRIRSLFGTSRAR